MVVHCIGWMASMRAEHFLCFSSSGVWGEGVVPVKCIWGPPVAWAAVRSRAVVLLLLASS